jgi:PAS domain S-box-containing protein
MRIDVGSEPPCVPQSQTEFEEFFDLALDLMVIAGFDGSIRRVNPAYERTLGYPVRELLSRPFLETVHPEDVAHVRNVFGELVDADRDDVIGFENRVICGDGSVRWLQWNTRTVRERSVVFGVGRDVTDRRRADAELREAQRTAEASRDELARLAEEHAALRRVATLVAHGAPPEALFTAVVKEVARVFPGVHATLARYESDGTATVVAISERRAHGFPVGSRWALGGKNVRTMVFETGRSARNDSYGDASGRLGVAVREQAPASVVGAPIAVEGHRWGVMTLASPEHPLPPDSEAQLASFSELVATAIANAEAQRELTASRARIVAAADEERRRVVRDLHDGAQQRLVHTIITLKLARRALENAQDDTPALMTEALDNAKRATDELRELAHGILPEVLTRGGLRAGVDTLASRMPVPVEIDVSVGRLPAAVEATAYFLVSEALTNVAKHSRAGHAEVTARIEDGMLAVHVRDDGIGGARLDGSGLLGLADRLAALGGQLRVESPTDGGTLIRAAIPIGGSSPELRS